MSSFSTADSGEQFEPFAKFLILHISGYIRELIVFCIFLSELNSESGSAIWKNRVDSWKEKKDKKKKKAVKESKVSKEADQVPSEQLMEEKP